MEKEFVHYHDDDGDHLRKSKGGNNFSRIGKRDSKLARTIKREREREKEGS